MWFQNEGILYSNDYGDFTDRNYNLARIIGNYSKRLELGKKRRHRKKYIITVHEKFKTSCSTTCIKPRETCLIQRLKFFHTQIRCKDIFFLISETVLQVLKQLRQFVLLMNIFKKKKSSSKT